MIIDKDFLFIGCTVKNKEDLFKIISKELLNKGYVKESFLEAILEREKEYPTGLEIGKINVAIPHTETHEILTDCLPVAILKNPVNFQKMDSPAEKIKVKIVFFPLATSGKASFLNKLLNIIKNFDILLKLYNLKDRENLCQLLSKLLNT